MVLVADPVMTFLIHQTENEMPRSSKKNPAKTRVLIYAKSRYAGLPRVSRGYSSDSKSLQIRIDVQRSTLARACENPSIGTWGPIGKSEADSVVKSVKAMRLTHGSRLIKGWHSCALCKERCDTCSTINGSISKIGHVNGLRRFVTFITVDSLLVHYLTKHREDVMIDAFAMYFLILAGGQNIDNNVPTNIQIADLERTWNEHIKASKRARLLMDVDDDLLNLQKTAERLRSRIKAVLTGVEPPDPVDVDDADDEA